MLMREIAKARAWADYRVGIEVEFYLVRGEAGPRSRRGMRRATSMSARTRCPALETQSCLCSRHSESLSEEHITKRDRGRKSSTLDAGALEMADQLIMVRHVVRTVAQRNGLRAMFMAKPFADAPGSGMRVSAFPA